MKKSDFRSRLKDAMNIRGLKAVDIVESAGYTKSKISLEPPKTLVEPTLLHKICGSRFKGSNLLYS